ncbi:inner membrane protein YohK [Paraliobacillus ryukyuensis]|uniref:Putative murein hydrolase (TIGR00659 family) n=1 Tax=Paraliobacillus ryukyuensis TaxID=200904 RepID=A0A366EEF3_9BACI|nr:LrgB family protein [Paraliobacillus ryukyuensis]RBP00698.1 putative murein hydrolase (TIGR00659 family) [Paraliobacillus ryukyuensis]
MIIVLVTIMTYVLYRFAKQLNKNSKIPLFHPLLFTPVLIIIIIFATHLSANTYLDGAKLLTHMLGPATIAFAVPIYKHLPVLKKYLGLILISITSGSLIAVFSSFGLSMLLHLDRSFSVSVLPRSITTPIAMEVSKDIGGLPTLTTVFVIITGIVGGMIGPSVIKRFAIKTPIAKGLALGMSAHGVGTNKAMEYGEEATTFSTLAMILAATITIVWGKLLIPSLIGLL